MRKDNGHTGSHGLHYKHLIEERNVHESDQRCIFLHDSTTVVALGTSQPLHRRGPCGGWKGGCLSSQRKEEVDSRL